MAVTAAIVGGIGALAGAGATIYSSDRQQKSAERAAKSQEQQFQAMQAKQAQEEAQRQAQAGQVAMQQRLRQRALLYGAMGGGGLGGFGGISPGGGFATPGQKTLLGM